MLRPSIRVLHAVAFDAGVDFDPGDPPSERTIAAWRTCHTMHSGEPEQSIMAVGDDELAALGFDTCALAA